MIPIFLSFFTKIDVSFLKTNSYCYFTTLSKGVLVPEEDGSKVRPTFWVGKKYLWCAKGSVCEIHGKEKTSWTYLNDHLFKDNSPVEKRS